MLGSAFLLAVIKGGEALGILFAGSVLVRALLLNALGGILKGGNGSGLLNGLVALVINDALEVVRGIFVSSPGEAGVPAGQVSVALGVALIQHHDAPPVVGAGLLLLLAVLQDALLGTSEDAHCLAHRKDGRNHAHASVGSSALGSVNGSLAALSGKAKSPAGLLGSALLLAVRKSRDALGVLLAGRPLVGALLCDALLGINGKVSVNLDGRCG